MAVILIVEDELLIAMAMEAALEEAGHKVLVARDGEEALAALEFLPVDLVITDYMMPGMDGAELLRLLRADERQGSIRALLVTALPREQIDGRVVGHDHHLQKPVADDVLLRVVSDLLQRH